MLHGVDNLGKSFLAAAVLLQNEQQSTYEWTLKTFIALVGEHRIQTVITDRDMALSNAIRIVLSGAYHQLCYFHVRQNVLRHAIDKKE